MRRAAGGVIHRHTLSLADEFAVIEAAYEAGVKVPRPYGYIPDLDGPRGVRDGAARGRHDRPPDRAEGGARRGPRGAARTDGRGAREDPRDPDRARRVPRRRRASSGWSRSSTRSTSRALRSSSGSGGCARTGRRARPVVVHGDYRIGNLVVGEDGPCRRARLGVRAPRRSRARPRVRARARVAVRRAGEAARRGRRRRAVPRALQRADRPRRASRGARLLGARRQRRLGDRLPHADAATPDRAGPERRARDARQARRRGRVRDRATCSRRLAA